jgi:hypothetical protein
MRTLGCLIFATLERDEPKPIEMTPYVFFKTTSQVLFERLRKGNANYPTLSQHPDEKAIPLTSANEN